MIFIDSSIFIANFLNNEKHHLKVRSILEEIYSEDLITSSDVVTETINWLTRKCNSKLIQDIGIILIEEEIADIVTITYENRLEALDVLKKYSDQKLSFTDATSFVLIKKLDIKKTISLDKHFSLLKGVENIFS